MIIYDSVTGAKNGKSSTDGHEQRGPFTG